MAHVIFTGDDFGGSPGVNAAILRAHRDGILTSASLLVTGEAASEAVALAREAPTLAVGLHLALARARSALAPEELPHLARPNGLLPDDAARAGVAWVLSGAARREIAREIAAQFDRFAATGLPLSHVDGHLNLHVHPAVLPHAVALAARYGARGFRLPCEGLSRAVRDGQPRTLGGAAEAIALDLLGRGGGRAARRAGLTTVDEVHGIVRSGRMDASYLVSLLATLRGRTAEIYLHPSEAPEEARGPNPGDLAALLDPAVRAALAAHRHTLATYATLEDA